MNTSVRIIGNFIGHPHGCGCGKCSGTDIIDTISALNITTPSLEQYRKLFQKDNPCLHSAKQIMGEGSTCIFCPDTFPTPHRVKETDVSIQYFCWIEPQGMWYSTHWRINDNFNVVVGVLQTSE